MAIQLGVIQFRGKVGQIVGRKKSKAQRANSIAAYQPTVSNPKTLAQRQQRVKMAAAVNFYRALAGILDHSWQGVEYGAASHSYFMKKALQQNSLFPYLVKGDSRAVPGYYMISKGGLPSVPDISFGLDNSEDFGYIYSSLLGDFALRETIGEASQTILDSEGGSLVQNGDQLTFIACIATDSDFLDENTQFVYKVFRFVIDTNSTTPFSDWLNSQGLIISNNRPQLFIRAADSLPVVAAAIIVSRPPLREGGAWQRSTTYLSIAGDIQRYFMDNNAREAALESYANSVSEVTSDWYLNQGTSNSTGTSGSGSSSRALASVAVTINGQQVQRLVMTQGNTSYLVAGPIENGSRYLYELGSDGVAYYNANTLTSVANVEATGLPVRLISTVQSYFPNLTVMQGNAGTASDNP